MILTSGHMSGGCYIKNSFSSLFRKDVAECIGYNASSTNKFLSTVDDDEKLNGTIFRLGQNREMWFLSEDGLYEVLMQSRKPILIIGDIVIKSSYHSPRPPIFANFNFTS